MYLYRQGVNSFIQSQSFKYNLLTLVSVLLKLLSFKVRDYYFGHASLLLRIFMVPIVEVLLAAKKEEQ